MADVTIYEHANFEGRSQVLAKGQYALEEISIGNDTLSSLKVPQGLVVRLYEHYHFQGRFIDIKQDTPTISQFWNDRASSIIVYGEDEQPPVTKEVMIFEHANHVGKSQILQKGEYDVPQILIGNDTLSSALVPSGMKLRLYEHANFQGAFIDIREDTRAVSLEWNDRASSIVVMPDFPENEVEVSRAYIPTEGGREAIREDKYAVNCRDPGTSSEIQYALTSERSRLEKSSGESSVARSRLFRNISGYPRRTRHSLCAFGKT